MNPNTIGPTKQSNLLCDRYYSRSHNRSFAINGVEFEGIPENLIINVVIWIILLLVFSILRKLAWDYGRIALVSRAEERPLTRAGESRYNVWTSLFFGERDASKTAGSQLSLDDHIHLKDKGFCSWIPTFFKIRDEDIQRKCGRDAVQYLSFQRYLLVYMTIVCVTSLAVILPVNYQGQLTSADSHSFADTTVGNIKPDSQLLWVHAAMALGYVALAIYFMRLFSMSIKHIEDNDVTRTLMITHMKKDKCYNNTIRKHFTEAYSGAVIENVQFAYDIAKLIKLDKERQTAREGRMNSEMIYNQTGVRPLMVPYQCGILFCCCEPCGCQKVDAIQYYAEEEKRLTEEVEKSKATAYQKCVGIGFVTFQTDMMAQVIYEDMKPSYIRCSRLPQLSSLSVEIDSIMWYAEYAPTPEDIYWENLSLHPTYWWIKAILINAVVTVVLFFMTTPSLLMNTLDDFDYKKKIDDLHSPVLVQFLPTVLLWTFSALLPYIVYYSDQLIGHWTRSSEHQAVMLKCFTFLMLMTLVLPSLGLTSAKALFEYLLSSNGETEAFRWRCIFLPDNGAFFVNYIITSAFIGTGLELIRFPELFMFIFRMMCARSAAERTSIRKKVLWEFQYGQNYAWLLCTFGTVIVYSIPCPLITPFGLIYLLLKHAVDRHNLYFAYAASKVERQTHSSAINYVMVSLILLLFNILFFLLLRSELFMGISVVVMIALIATIILFVGRIFFGLFKIRKGHSYKHFENVDDDMDEDEINYKQPSHISQPLNASQNNDSVTNTNIELTDLIGGEPFVPNILKDELRMSFNGDVSSHVSPAGSYGAIHINVTHHTDDESSLTEGADDISDTDSRINEDYGYRR